MHYWNLPTRPAWNLSAYRGMQGDPAPNVKFQYSADAINWHDEYNENGDAYMRSSNDGGDTWSDAMQFKDNSQFFQSGEQVNQTRIVNEFITGGEHDVLSAEQGKLLNQTLQSQGESLQEIDVSVNGGTRIVEQTIVHPTSANNKYYNTNNATIPNSSSNREGCHAVSIDVQEGEQYIVSGIGGGGAALRLWALADADNVRNTSYIGAQTGTARTTPVTITIPQGMVRLVFNLASYDPNTDYVKKLVEEEVTGLDERVEHLEESIPEIVDNLIDGGDTKALSAEQGKMLNDEINGSYGYVTITPYTLQDKNQNGTSTYITVNDGSLGTLNGTLYNRVDNVQGRLFRVYGKGATDAVPLVIWADSSRKILSVVKGTYRTTPYIATPPNNAYYMVVNMMDYSSSTDKIEEYLMIESGLVQEIEAKQAEIDLSLPLKGKKVMFFGDSISYFSGLTGNIPANFAKVSKASCYSAAVGGTRLVPRMAMVQTPTTQEQAYAALDIHNMVAAWASGDYTYQQAAVNYLNDHSYAYNYQSRLNNMTNCPISTADIVIIGGGTNDFSVSSPMGSDTDTTTATVKGAIANIVTTLLSANPKLKIYFWTPIVGRHKSGSLWVWDDTYTNNNNMTKPHFIEAITQAAKLRHVPMIDMYWSLGWNETNFNEYFYADQVNPSGPDYTHPHKGYDVIARRLYWQIKSLME